MRRRPLLCALSLAALSMTGAPRARGAEAHPAAADTVAGALADDAKSRGAALGTEAVFERVKLAYEVSGRAVHGLELARLLARAGDPVRALGVYRAVATTPPSEPSPAGEAEAVELAKAEMAKLLLVIPRVVLEVSPRSMSGLKLTVDGKPVVPGVPLMVRPGEHTVDAGASGFSDKRVFVSVVERDRKQVVVALESNVKAGPAPAVATPQAAEPAQAAVVLPPLHGKRPEPPREEEARGSPRGASQRMLGYFFIGWGAAALIGGGVATYLEHEHPGDKRDLLHTLSLVGFGAGGGLAILGLTVVLTAPSGTYQTQAAAPGARFVPGMVAVKGFF